MGDCTTRGEMRGKTPTHGRGEWQFCPPGEWLEEHHPHGGEHGNQYEVAKVPNGNLARMPATPKESTRALATTFNTNRTYINVPARSRGHGQLIKDGQDAGEIRKESQSFGTASDTFMASEKTPRTLSEIGLTARAPTLATTGGSEKEGSLEPTKRIYRGITGFIRLQPRYHPARIFTRPRRPPHPPWIMLITLLLFII